MITAAQPLGRGQSFLKGAISFGAPGVPTYAKFNPGESVELAAVSALDNLGGLSSAITLNLSAGDVFDAESAAFVANQAGKFLISSASSPSADYNFSNTAFVGLAVEWNSGVNCSTASFFNCREVLTDGAPFEACKFYGTPVTTSNPTNITNCSFTQGATGGHAIEITQPGTYSFVGNTFEGYGLDGTTDAAIYNNSGGHVTLNISGGGDTPTVRNGTGASTTVVSGVTLTFSGIKVGSEIHIFDENSVLLASVESAISNQTISLQVTGVQVRIFIASLGYENIDLPYTVPGSDVTIPVFQRIDRNYRNPI